MRSIARNTLSNTLSRTLDAALWLVNVQMLAIGALGQLVRRLSTEHTQSESTPLP